MDVPKTSISSYGTVDSEPTETYGSGPVILRIGNGGAGATGLIRALAEDYLSFLDRPGSITWVCNHSRNTQLALLRNHVDIALTYERLTEDIAEVEGWSKTFGCAFHDHFVLAGPAADPAGVKTCKSLVNALERIAEAGGERSEGVIWHARNDDSATMWKERALWGMTQEGLEPWKDEKCFKSWYQMSVRTPAEAIQKADAEGAYLLTDRATVLCQTGLQTISRTTVFVEPRSEDDVLMNSCYGLYSPEKERESNEYVNMFLKYVVSERGQKLIEDFGEEQVGVPFFARVGDGYARSSLKNGVAKNKRWTFD